MFGLVEINFDAIALQMNLTSKNGQHPCEHSHKKPISKTFFLKIIVLGNKAYCDEALRLTQV